MSLFKISLIAVVAMCLILPGCSMKKGRYLINAPWGYMRVECPSDQIGSAVSYVATEEGVKQIKQKHQSYGDLMKRSRYIYTTPDGVTVEVISFREQGEPIRVFVSIDPEDDVKLKAITNSLWDRIPKE